MRLAASLLIICATATALLCACGGNEPVSFKSGGMTHTFVQGKAATQDFPLPIYPGAKPIGANSASGDADDEHFMMLSSKDPADKVVDFYMNKLKEDGWTVKNTSFMPQLNKVDAKKPGLEASVMISSDEKQTSISLAVSKESSGVPQVAGQEFTPDKLNPPTD